MLSILTRVYHRAQYVLKEALDYIFPRTPIEIEVDKLTMPDIFAFPPAERLSDTSLHALWNYHDPRVKECVWRIKFYEDERITRMIGHVLGAHIAQTCPHDTYLIIPVPISPRRRKERGYNQTEQIAIQTVKHVDQTRFTYAPHILIKNNDTAHQTGESRVARLNNLKGSFSVQEPTCIQGKNIIIVDDVITTGATCHEIMRMLLHAGARHVQCIGLAH